ncbi:hypothetical protein RRG08_001436 [Elysia crispata]|uniref:Uncharacterized protein n=1 Tax=Elysia crispata TaxID=231223 RepID=A0AAE0ZQX6_9GAST|nr:hypothetical protein RRG08_001436 [Elysia crispata]
MTAFCSQESSQSNIIASSTVCDVTGPFKALRNPRSGNDSLRLRDKTIEAFNPWQSGMIPLLRSLGSVDPVGVTVLPTPITSRLMARRARFLVSSKICHSSRSRVVPYLVSHVSMNAVGTGIAPKLICSKTARLGAMSLHERGLKKSPDKAQSFKFNTFGSGEVNTQQPGRRSESLGSNTTARYRPRGGAGWVGQRTLRQRRSEESSRTAKLIYH